MLAECIGRQREGWLRATHQKIADKLGVERSNVPRALGRLEGRHMLQLVDTGLIFVNPLLGFEGNGDVQHEVLETLRRGAPEGAFPEPKAPPAPRSVQLETLAVQLQFAVLAGQRRLLEPIRLSCHQVPEVRCFPRRGDGSGSVVRWPGDGGATRTSSAPDRLSAGVSVGDDGGLPGAAGLLPR
ncbi:hypothetical protein [Streptomyces sp. NPDC055186]